MASDRTFAVALLTLWHRSLVPLSGPVQRHELAATTAPVVADLTAGRAHGVALIAERQLVGFAALVPGQRSSGHTGRISVVLVDPGVRRRGLGTRLVIALLELAADLAVELVEVSVPEGDPSAGFFHRLGFTEGGRRSGWIRVAPGLDRDEIRLVWTARPAR